MSRRPTYALAGVLVALLGFFPFVRGERVPILGFVDLAIHEAGHLFFVWAPQDVMLAMGNGFQALMPLVVAGAFVLKHRDLAGGAVGLAWCASALQDASVYIADAPTRNLPLLGPEDSHDWWQILGRHALFNRADDIAQAVLVVGFLVFLLAVIVYAVGLRWDDVWRHGEEGTLFLPWQREAELARLAAEEAARPERLRDGGDDAPPPRRKARVIW